MKINQSLFLFLLIASFITSVKSDESFFKKHTYVVVGSCSALLGVGIFAYRYHPWNSKKDDNQSILSEEGIIPYEFSDKPIKTATLINEYPSSSNQSINSSPDTFDIRKMLQPIIEKWDIKYVKKDSKELITWNPLLLIIEAYETFDAYSFYTEKDTENIIKLLTMDHIAQGKNSKTLKERYPLNKKNNDAFFETTFKSLKEKLHDYGHLFIPAFITRASEITIEKYCEEERALFDEIMKLSDEDKETLFNVTQNSIKTLSPDSLKPLATKLKELITNKLPIACFKYNTDDQEIIASTDSQGSFDPLIPIKQIREFFQQKNKRKQTLIRAHCGDNVDKIGNNCRMSNWFGLLAYQVLSSIGLEMSALLSREFKEVLFMLSPGNHDVWHQPASEGTTSSKDWSELESVIEEFGIKSIDANKKIAIAYALNSIVMPKRHMALCTDKQNSEVIKQFVNTQHSIFLEPIIIANKGDKIKKGSWLTWGTRIEKNELTTFVQGTITHHEKAKNIIDSLKESFNIEQNSQNKWDENILIARLNRIRKTFDCEWLGNKSLINILTHSCPTLWCDFRFDTIYNYDAKRGYDIHHSIVQFLGYNFIDSNKYQTPGDIPIVLYFGHSHGKDQESTRLMNYALNTPPYSLNTVFKINNTTFDSNIAKNILAYTKYAICHYKNQPQENILVQPGVHLSFLPISPITCFENEHRDMYTTEVDEFLQKVLNDSNTTLTKKIINDKKINFTNLHDRALSLKLPYYVLNSNNICRFASCEQMHSINYADLFDPNKQEKPFALLGEYIENLEGFDYQNNAIQVNQ